MAKQEDRSGYGRFTSRKYSLEEANRALTEVEGLKMVKAVIEP